MDARFDAFPADNVECDPKAYQRGLEKMSPGDIVTVFTPDDTHFSIALDAINQGCHVLVAKPLVKTVGEHLALSQAAEEKGVLAAMEVHKRWDPLYTDARDRIRSLGDFSFFAAYMSQPKSQLDTFRAWAGKSSDISYYLNAHHVDFNLWAVSEFARPLSVHASAAAASPKDGDPHRRHDHPDRRLGESRQRQPSNRCLHVLVDRSEERRSYPAAVLLHGAWR